MIVIEIAKNASHGPYIMEGGIMSGYILEVTFIYLTIPSGAPYNFSAISATLLFTECFS